MNTFKYVKGILTHTHISGEMPTFNLLFILLNKDYLAAEKQFTAKSTG